MSTSPLPQLPALEARDWLRHIVSELPANVVRTTASVYETAWVARVRTANGAIRFPEAVRWLRAQQQADGSWGPPGAYAVIPTMAALVALHEAGDSPAALLTSGYHALQQAVLLDAFSELDTPFIEFIVPQLASLLDGYGYPLTIPSLPQLLANRSRKLRAIPQVTARTPLLHGIEALAVPVDATAVLPWLEPESLLGGSPAATAWLLQQIPTLDEAEQTLRSLLQLYDGGVPSAHPVELFELVWILWLFLEGGCPVADWLGDQREFVVNWIRAGLTEQGASISRIPTITPDADDTALALGVLWRLGETVAAASLVPLWTGTHVRTFPFESSWSITTTAHVLHALHWQPDPRFDWESALTTTIIQAQQADGTWSDKWSISPFYVLWSCVSALAVSDRPESRAACQRATRYLLATQRADGSWGTDAANGEETAYALLALAACAAVPQARPIPVTASWTPHWIDKDRYGLPRVAQAAAYAATAMQTRLQRSAPATALPAGAASALVLVQHAAATVATTFDWVAIVRAARPDAATEDGRRQLLRYQQVKAQLTDTREAMGIAIDHDEASALFAVGILAPDTTEADLMRVASTIRWLYTVDSLLDAPDLKPTSARDRRAAHRRFDTLFRSQTAPLTQRHGNWEAVPSLLATVLAAIPSRWQRRLVRTQLRHCLEAMRQEFRWDTATLFPSRWRPLPTFEQYLRQARLSIGVFAVGAVLVGMEPRPRPLWHHSQPALSAAGEVARLANDWRLGHRDAQEHHLTAVAINRDQIPLRIATALHRYTVAREQVASPHWQGTLDRLIAFALAVYTPSAPASS